MRDDKVNDEINLDPTDTARQETSSKGSGKWDNRKPTSPQLLLFQILMTGTAGWKDLRRSRLTPEQTAARCFYPLIALTAICRFADWFYLPEFILSKTLVSAASVFIAFFFSCFAVQVVCKWLFPYEAKRRTDSNYFKLMVQYSLASLALFWIPAEILPILEPLTVFLPIWTAFIITKGIRFLRLPEKHNNRCMITMIASTIIMPYFFMWLSGKIF